MFSGGAGRTHFGTAYKMTPAGDVTVLHAFTREEGEARNQASYRPETASYTV
jgi:hypothetical protein